MTFTDFLCHPSGYGHDSRLRGLSQAHPNLAGHLGLSGSIKPGQGPGISVWCYYYLF